MLAFNFEIMKKLESVEIITTMYREKQSALEQKLDMLISQAEDVTNKIHKAKMEIIHDCNVKIKRISIDANKCTKRVKEIDSLVVRYEGKTLTLYTLTLFLFSKGQISQESIKRSLGSVPNPRIRT